MLVWGNLDTCLEQRRQVWTRSAPTECVLMLLNTLKKKKKKWSSISTFWCCPIIRTNNQLKVVLLVYSSQLLCLAYRHCPSLLLVKSALNSKRGCPKINTTFYLMKCLTAELLLPQLIFYKLNEVEFNTSRKIKPSPSYCFITRHKSLQSYSL